MTWRAQRKQWRGNRAVLLVHGIGNAAPGDYAIIADTVRDTIGADGSPVAVYQLYYDQVNDWFTSKNQLGALLTEATRILATRIDDPELGETLAELVGDVLWPVLLADARAAVREAYLLQLKRIVDDGVSAGIPARDQRLSIICHSLGCFHTYEALHHAALFPSHLLQPAAHGVRFENVIFMASPVQLIRTIADAMGNLVPNKRWLYTVQGDTLSIPRQAKLMGGEVLSVNNWVSITGNLDPVGGYFFRRRADWAYMKVPGETVAIVQSQDALDISTKAQLVDCFRACIREREPPKITPKDPHCWESYVNSHATQLRSWLT